MSAPDRLIDSSLTDLIGRMIRQLPNDRVSGNQRRGYELLGRLREFYSLPDPPDETDSTAFEALAELAQRYISDNLNPPEVTATISWAVPKTI